VPTQDDINSLLSNATGPALTIKWSYGGFALSGGMQLVTNNAYYGSTYVSGTDWGYLVYTKDTALFAGDEAYMGLQIRCVK
jgi:hypothetical protein